VGDFVEGNNTFITFLGLIPGENGGDDDGGDIPGVHDELGDEVSRLSGGIPNRHAEDERPDEDGVNNDQDHQELNVIPEVFLGYPGEWDSSLQGNEPALLDGHAQHTHLPKHVRNVVKDEVVEGFLGSVFTVRGVDEDHVEVQQGEELEGGHILGGHLEVVELGIKLDLDTAVVADHEDDDRKGMKLENQRRDRLGWIEIQERAGVVEVEHLVNVGLGGVEVTWCSVKKLVHERARVVVDREVDHVSTEEQSRQKKGTSSKETPEPDGFDVDHD